MHPEDTLDLPQALAVFDLAKTAIIFLVRDLIAKGMISVPAKPDPGVL
jgi:hypothetical protein